MAIEKYASLCALMKDTAGDLSKEEAIASAQGVTMAEWTEAKTGFTAMMSDPADMGKTAMAFMPIYQAALENMSGGKEPCTLEQYAKIHAEMAFRKDAADPTKKVDYNLVLAENGFVHQTWLECENYWTPRVVNDPKLGAALKYVPELGEKFQILMQKESDRINGIVR